MENENIIEYDYDLIRVIDLLEKIREVNKMIELHQGEMKDELMVMQYIDLKSRFLEELQEAFEPFKVQISLPQAA